MAAQRLGPGTDRPGAPAYGDGFYDERFFSAGPFLVGKPYVMVHKGDTGRVTVGSHVRFAEDVVLIAGGNHRVDWVPTCAVRELLDLPGAYEGNPWSRGDIVIGSDVTFGGGSRVLSGVAIGDGAVVREHSVVTKDVRPFAIVQGAPAREVARRFDDDEVARLLADPWWRSPATTVRQVGVAGARLVVRGALSSLATRARGLLDRRRTDFPADMRLPDASVFEIGEGSIFPPILHVDPTSGHRLTIGRFASVAFDAEFVLDGSAEPPPASAVALNVPPARDAGTGGGGSIVVGHDAWVARGAKVMPGVTIGVGSVVAAYSVVTEDVRPYAIVAGNPATEVGRRFDDETVEALLEIAWWHWSVDEVAAAAADLTSGDVEAFIARYRPTR